MQEFQMNVALYMRLAVIEWLDLIGMSSIQSLRKR